MRIINLNLENTYTNGTLYGMAVMAIIRDREWVLDEEHCFISSTDGQDIVDINKTPSIPAVGFTDGCGQNWEVNISEYYSKDMEGNEILCPFC